MPRNDTLSNNQIASRFKDFIKEWMVENEFIYRDQLKSNG